MTGFEQQIFLWFNSSAGSNGLLDALARLFVNDYVVPVSLSLLLLGVWFAGRTPEQRRRHQRAILAVPFALVLVNIAVATVNAADMPPDRNRPFQDHPHALATAQALFYPPPDPAFPSNSVAVAFALVGVAWFANAKIGMLATVFGLGLGLSRVYAGVHYPLDIVAGLVLGLLGSGAGWLLLTALEPVPSLFLRLARRLYLA